MGKHIKYSIIAFIFYNVIVYVFNLFFSFLLLRDEFLDINEAYLQFSETSTYLFLIGVAIVFIRKWNKNYVTESKVSLKNILIILFAVVFYRLLEDPFLRIDIITGNKSFPVIKNALLGNGILNKIISLLNIVVLAAIFEELFFRRIILNFFPKSSMIFGVFFSSFLFALIHIKGYDINYTTIILAFLFGITTCIIYVKYGLLYSILFHIGYNFIWFLLQEYRDQYWRVLKDMNFGVNYWVIIIISLGVIVFFNYKCIKNINQIYPKV